MLSAFLVPADGLSPETMMLIQKGIYITVVFLGPLLAFLPRTRPWILSRPLRTLSIILGLDLLFMLWATIPYVPWGIDESYFVINSHVYRGNDLYLTWLRPPLPGLGAALCPWHPPLVGLLLKTLTGWLVYKLASRPLGPGGALLAVWLTQTSTRLCSYSAYMLSEPYGAAVIIGFALLAARGAGAGTGLLASVGFLCRWPLAWLWPLATFLGFRRQRYWGALVATLLFWLPAVLVLWWSDADPWRVLSGRSAAYSTKPVLDTFLYFLTPKISFGLDPSAFLAALVGFVLVLRSPRASRELTWCAVLLGVNAGILIMTGEAVVRFMAPTIPLACVLAVHALRALHHRAMVLQRMPILVGVLVGGIAVASCLPVRPPKLRMKRMASPQNVVREHREVILRIIRDQPLYSDTEFLTVTAVLSHPVHAVYDRDALPADPKGSKPPHPRGVTMDWEGKFPDKKREDLPKGAMYLTFDPGGRKILWQARELYLVRW